MTTTSYIKIKDFGPLKEIELHVKKYNIFIGSSGAGKSTLAKLICNALRTVEELVVYGMEGTAKAYLDNLLDYHNLRKHLRTDTLIEYTSDCVSFQFKDGNFSYDISTLVVFRREATMYIPAERNVVSVIPNWFDINLPKNSLRDFLSSWETARRHYTMTNPLPLKAFNAHYYCSEAGMDIITIAGGKELKLNEVASGIQAVLPIAILSTYQSFPDLEPNSSIRTNAALEAFTDKIIKDYRQLGADNDREARFDAAIKFFEIKGTNLFIEEPELNLFPTLQKELLMELVRIVNQVDHNSLTITTHSPYILAFISNYIYAHHLQYEMHIDVDDIVPEELMIDPNDVSAYLLRDGRAVNLLTDPTLGIEIKDLDEVSDEINETWQNLVDREFEK